MSNSNPPAIPLESTESAKDPRIRRRRRRKKKPVDLQPVDWSETVVTPKRGNRRKRKSKVDPTDPLGLNKLMKDC